MSYRIRITVPVPISMVSVTTAPAYRPMARIWCASCGAVADAPSGTRICACDPLLIGYVSGVR